MAEQWSNSNLVTCSTASITALTSKSSQKTGIAAEISKKAGSLKMKLTRKDKDKDSMNKVEKSKCAEDNVPLKQCNCSCMVARSESFYDVFLAPSVKESKEYRQLLVDRYNRKNGTLKTPESDVDIQDKDEAK